MAQQGELGMVSASFVEGRAPVKAIRYSTDPNDGWWILAAEDLPDPAVENIRAVCVHCLTERYDIEVARGLQIARAYAEQDADGVGAALWEAGSWVTGENAYDAFE